MQSFLKQQHGRVAIGDRSTELLVVEAWYSSYNITCTTIDVEDKVLTRDRPIYIFRADDDFFQA